MCSIGCILHLFLLTSPFFQASAHILSFQLPAGVDVLTCAMHFNEYSNGTRQAHTHRCVGRRSLALPNTSTCKRGGAQLAPLGLNSSLLLRCSGLTKVICVRLLDHMSLRKLWLDSFPRPPGPFPWHRYQSWKSQLLGVNVLTCTLPFGEYSVVFGTCGVSCFLVS